MRAENFIQFNTLLIVLFGFFAFVFDTIGGILVAKLMNVFSKEKIKPMLGAAGISVLLMAAKTVQRMAVKEDSFNNILMHSIGTKVSGQVASAIVGGLILGMPVFM